MTPLTVVTLTFAAGTVVGLRVTLSAAVLLLAVAVLAAVAALLASRVQVGANAGAAEGPSGGRAVRSIPIAPIAALFLGIGFLSAAGAASRVRTDCRARFTDGATLSVRGVLEGTPTADGAGLLRLETVRAGGRDVPCPGTVRVTLPGRGGRLPPAGARLSASGRWWAYPAQSAWPVGPERRGTLGLRSVRVVEGGTAQPLLQLRSAAQDRLRRLFPERSGLAEALLIAQRGGIDPAVRLQFAASGLTHLLSISGTHVGLVAGVLLLIVGVLRLPSASGAVAAAAGTVAYVLFLGAPHAAARAALQVLLLLAARLAQRPSDPYTLLAFAGLVLLVLDPLALLDAGFQLSFAGIFGLLSLRRPLLARLPARWPRWLRDGLASGTAATLATTPIAALHFGLIAVIGIVANLAAIPLVGLCVPAVALALLLGALLPAPGAFFASGADLLLAALARTAALAAAVPFGHTYVSRGAVLAWLAAVGGALLAVGWMRERLDGGARRRLPLLAGGASAAGLAVLMAWPSAGRGAGDALEIHAIDVGQGDAFAIRSPGGRWVVVDAGPRSEDFDAGRSRVVPFLLRHGADRVEAVIMTHPHMDHIGGVEALVDALDVRAVIDPAIAEPNETYARTITRLRQSGVRWYAAREGRELRIGDMVIRFLAPLERILDAPGDPNDYSVVFRLDFGRFGALFTGDAPMHVEDELVALHGGALNIDFLKVGHHGSRTSTGDSLLVAATPQVALIPAGRRNRYGHPAPEVVARLARHGVRVLRTDEDGSLTVRVHADGRITVSPAR